MAVDYEQLAKQYGGAAAPSTDYDALANKFGGTSTPAKPETNYDDIAKQFGGALVPSTPAPAPAAPPQAAAPEEKSSLWEFPKALVRGAYDLKGMYAGLQQRGAALGMETPQAAMDVFNKIDAGEIKSKADLSKLIGEERRLPTAEEMVQGDSRLGAKVRTFNLARDYLNATPEERKALRAQMQSDIQQGGKDLASAIALGEQVKKEAAPYEARVKSLFDIENFADAMSYLGSTSGQAIPQMVPMVGAALLTRGKAAAPAAVGAGMELGAGTQNRVDFISDKIKDETDPSKRIDKIGKYIQDTSDVTVTAAIMNGALDAVLGPEKDIAKAVAAQSLKDMTRKEIAKQIPKAVAKSGAKEFFTGGMQETVQINAERMLGEQTGDAFTKENIKRVVDSAMAEAIGGATVTTGFEAVRAATAQKDVSKLDTPEGRALRGLDTLAEEEERVAGPRRPADLTPQEVSNIERRLYAELGRAPNDYEFEEAVDDYLDEQNAGRGVEPGAGIAGVPSAGVAETAGVPDTTIPTAPEPGRLGVAGGAPEVAGVREGVQPGALDILGEIKLRDQFGSLYDQYKELEAQSEDLENQLSQFGVNTFSIEEDIQAAREKQQQAAALQNLDPTAAAMIGERQLADLLAQTRLTNYESRLLESEASPVVDSYMALKEQMAALDSEMEPIIEQLDAIDTEKLVSEARKTATPKAEEVITEEPAAPTETLEEQYRALSNEELGRIAFDVAGRTDEERAAAEAEFARRISPTVTEAKTEAPASVESIAASYADQLFAANPDYDVADFDKAESDLFSDLIDKGITGTESRKLATKAFEERLNALEENRGKPPASPQKPTFALPEEYAHGTDYLTSQNIIRSGRLVPDAGKRMYSYSQFGRKAVYLTAHNGWWLDADQAADGRAAVYDASVPFKIDPKAKIREVNSYTELDAIAREIGEPSAAAMMSKLGVENLDNEQEAREVRGMSFDEYVDRKINERREILQNYGVPQAESVVDVASLAAYEAEQYKDTPEFARSEEDILNGFQQSYDFLQNYEDQYTAADEVTQKLLDVGIDGIYIGPNYSYVAQEEHDAFDAVLDRVRQIMPEAPPQDSYDVAVEEYKKVNPTYFERSQDPVASDQLALFRPELAVVDRARLAADRPVITKPALSPSQYLSIEPPTDTQRKLSFRTEVGRVMKAFNEDRISAEDALARVDTVYDETKGPREVKPRKRGGIWIRQKLLGAVGEGVLPEKAFDFAQWLINTNPALVDDLGISVRAAKEGNIAAGGYNPFGRIFTLFKDRASETTAVHEILHHMERMMPEDVQDEIRKLWAKRLILANKKAQRGSDADLKSFFNTLSNYHFGGAQSEMSYRSAMEMIADGKVAPENYQYANASEFWAVNATDIMARRFGAKDAIIRKLKQWLREFVQKVKAAFGLSSDAPIINALDSLLKGDGKFQSDSSTMLGGGSLMSVEEFKKKPGETEDAYVDRVSKSTGSEMAPNIVEMLRNNDLNGALRGVANILPGFYGTLANRLAQLDMPTGVRIGDQRNLTRRGIDNDSARQQIRLFGYLRNAAPDFFNKYFNQYDRVENLETVYIGLMQLPYDVSAAKLGPVRTEYDTVLQAFENNMPGLTALGAYYPLFDEINLNDQTRAYGTGMRRELGLSYRTFLHESVHAATEILLNTPQDQRTTEQNAAIAELERLYEYAIGKISGKRYGFTNISEFIAEVMTNRSFQNELKAIPYPAAKTNIFTQFVQAIMKLVGLDNVAGRAMVEAEKLFTPARPFQIVSAGPRFAQAPKKRRVRGPISTPDTYRTAETQQNTLNQTLKDAYEGRMEWKDAIKILGPSLWDAGNTVLRKTALPVMNLTQLEDLTRTKFTQITGALKIIRDMVAYRAKKMNSASEIMRDWTKAQKKNFAQSQLMGRIMMEATIRGIDPDTAPAGALNKPLQDAWNTLNPEFKAIYRRVRDFYADSVNEMVREAKRRASAIQDPAARAKALQKIDEQFGPDKLVKPYFPLRRFGQYWYQVGSGNFKEFYEFENPFARDLAMRRRAQELSKGNKQQRDLARTMTKGNGISELYGRNISTTQALKDVQDLVDNITATDAADLKDQLKDSLNQLIYILLPQQSVRKMFINRKAIQGASADMLRVFATTAVHSAYQQSRFMYSEKFLQNLNNARSEIDDAQKTGMLSTDTAAMYRDFIFEVEQRVPTIMSNEDTSMTAQIAGKASELTFYYMLSAPFTALLNTIGAVQLAMPYLGGSYGYTRANALLAKNMGRYLATSPTRTFAPLAKGTFAQVNFPSIVEGGKLPPLLQKAADRFIDDGLIDISLTNDIFELGERPSALYTGVSATVKKVMSGLFHQSERMNREIVLLTTFELAYDKFLKDYQRQPGMEGLRGVYLRDAQGKKIKNTPDQAFELAVEEATRLTSSSLGDYSRQTKGRVFANPIMNLLLKFKQYPILAMYSILRNFHVGMVAPFKKAELDQYRELLEKELQNDPNKDQVIAQRMQEVEAQRKALEKEGRRRLAGILGVTTILGGVAASPFFSLVVGPLVKMFAGDDDDDYFDWENWFYNYMEGEFGGYLGAMLANAGMKPETAEKAGRTAGEVVARGVPAAMGAALSDRISLDPKALLWRDGRYSPDARENFIESLIANAGPVVGLGLNFVDAYQLVKEGQYARAVEKAVPAIIAKPASAVRMGMEGAKTKKGDVLIDDFTATELAMQAIGLQPERLAQKQKAGIAMKQKEQKILDERAAIMNRLWLERDNDSGFDAALDRATEFSSKHPAKAITAKNIQESFEKRAKAAAEAEAVGAKIDKKLRGELIDMGGFASDE